MTNLGKRVLLSLAFIGVNLVLEFLFCATISGLIVAYRDGREHFLDGVLGIFIVFGYSVVYRAMFLHLFASWGLKLFLILRHLTAPLIALADLVLALLYAGVLSLFLLPAAALFENGSWWIPIFAAIFLGSLFFILLFRRQVVSVWASPGIPDTTLSLSKPSRTHPG